MKFLYALFDVNSDQYNNELCRIIHHGDVRFIYLSPIFNNNYKVLLGFNSFISESEFKKIVSKIPINLYRPTSYPKKCIDYFNMFRFHADCFNCQFPNFECV